MLAVPGCFPDATLKDLADDPRFTGLVLCELLPHSIAVVQDDAMQEKFPDLQSKYTKYYHSSWSSERAFERLLRATLEENLVLAAPQLRLDLRALPEIVRVSFQTRRWPSLPHSGAYRSRLIRKDGSNAIDFTRFDVRQSVAGLEDAWRFLIDHYKPLSDQDWLAYVRRLGQLAARINAQGGRVVFIDYPINGRQKSLIDRYYPREPFWTLMARETGATVIQSEKVPSLASFSCPDGLHMDYRDALDYTRNLVTVLREQHLLPLRPGEELRSPGRVALRDAAGGTGRLLPGASANRPEHGERTTRATRR